MGELLCGKPLTFGNVDQIMHIKQLRAKERIKEEREAKIKAGELREFEVTLKVEGSHTIKVFALNKNDAEDAACEKFSPWDVDDLECEVSYVEYVDEIKKKRLV